MQGVASLDRALRILMTAADRRKSVARIPRHSEPSEESRPLAMPRSLPRLRAGVGMTEPASAAEWTCAALALQGRLMLGSKEGGDLNASRKS
jgi:hypothetical protein